jgi:hypothetical protein
VIEIEIGMAFPFKLTPSLGPEKSPNPPLAKGGEGGFLTYAVMK